MLAFLQPRMAVARYQISVDVVVGDVLLSR